MKATMTGLVLTLMFAGCASQADQDELRSDVAALTARLDKLEAASVTSAAAESGGRKDKAGRKGGKERLDEEARQRFGEVTSLLSAYDVAGALAAATTIAESYSDETKLGRRARRVAVELALIGTTPGLPDVETWHQGSASDIPWSDGVVLVVFFGAGQKKAAQQLAQVDALANNASPPLTVLGVARAGEEDGSEAVRAVIEESGVTWPVAQGTQAATETYAVQGLPAIALVRAGTVLWRGHAEKTDAALISHFLGG